MKIIHVCADGLMTDEITPTEKKVTAFECLKGI